MAGHQFVSLDQNPSSANLEELEGIISVLINCVLLYAEIPLCILVFCCYGSLELYASVILQSSATALAIGSSNQKSVKSHAVLQPAQNSYPGQQFIVTSTCLKDVTYHLLQMILI